MPEIQRIIVTIDNEDAALAPLRPWTATIAYDGTEASGIGSTPLEALSDLVDGWADEEAKRR